MAINKIILFGAILAVGNAGVIAVAPVQYSAVPTQFSAAAFHHSASLGPYSDATAQYSANSNEHSSAPIQYSAATTHYPAAAVHHSVTPVQNPVRYTTAPTQYSANPVQYSSAPVQYSMVPTQYSAAAAHHSAAPVQYSAAPFQHPTTTNGFSGVQAQYLTGSPGMVKGVSPVHYPHAPAVAKEEEDYDPNPQYTYGYDVQDGQTGDSKNHSEQRQGDAVQGSYSLVDPDGHRRTVEYTADSVHGFNAVVRREPLQGAHVAKVAAPGYVSTSAPSYHH